MAATFSFAERNNSGWTGSIANLNFGSTDSAELTPLDYPITAGSNSYEKWIVGSFSGTFTKIDNIRFWKSSGTYVTGEVIKWTGSETTFSTPTQNTSTVAVGSVPESEPASANVTIGGSLTGSLTATGSTDYIVLQLQTTTSTPAGAVNQKEFTLAYDEI